MASFSLNRRHLIIGGDGMIGARLWRRLRDDGAAVWASTRRRDQAGPDRPYVDSAARDWSALDALPISADVTIHVCAAAARIAQCAADPEGARQINVEGVVDLAQAMAPRGAHILFLSTNQVLPGDRPLAPADTPYGGATDYGRQKAEAEQQLLAMVAPVAILRLAKVLTVDDPLIAGWRSDLRAGRTITPFYDMTAAPVAAGLVVEAIVQIASLRETGVFQLSATRDVSYAELAEHIARAEGYRPSLVQPVSVASGGLAHTPPPYTSLDAGRLKAATGLEPPTPFDAICTGGSSSGPRGDRL